MSRQRFIVALAAGLLLASVPSSADRLHLASGGVIETGEWWIDGDDLLYRSLSGTVGIPRSMVVRIETSDAPVAKAAPEPLLPPSRRARERDAARIDEVRQQIEEGVAALEGGDCETASSRFHHAMSLEPKAYAARVQYAYCEIRMDQDPSALAAVLDGLVLHPDGAELHELLGDLRDREENLVGALESWRRAFELAANDRLKDKIAKGQRDLNSRRNYDFARTSHFNLRYDGTVDEALAAEVSKHLEADFNKKFLTMQVGQAKKGMDAMAFDKACKAFCLALDGPVASLAKECKKLVTQHQAAIDIDNE